MFSYYGSKRKIAHLYPKPEYDLIIEPFCGAAWYSFLYPEKRVMLNDINPVISRIWDFLINNADPDFILKHSDFNIGDDIRDLGLSIAHEELIGFCINRGTAHPCNIVQKWSCQVASKPYWASTASFALKRIAKMIPLISHWDITQKHFKDMPDVEGTWFIDPPYQNGGIYYNQPKINYNELSEWCQSRKGQVIVCENGSANWLPFAPLITQNGQRRKTIESIFLNQSHE